MWIRILAWQNPWCSVWAYYLCAFNKSVISISTRTLTSLKSCLSLQMFSEIYRLKKNISLKNIKILKFISEVPISYNKEKINIAPSPPGKPLAFFVFVLISLINMKILILMFEGPISNNKEKIKIAPSPLAKIIEFLWIIRRY